MWPLLIYNLVYTLTVSSPAPHALSTRTMGDVAVHYGFPSGNIDLSLDSNNNNNYTLNLASYINHTPHYMLYCDRISPPPRTLTVSTSSARAALVPDYNYSMPHSIPLPRSEYMNPPHTSLSSLEGFQERSLFTGSGADLHHVMVDKKASSLSSHTPGSVGADDDHTLFNTPATAILDYINSSRVTFTSLWSEIEFFFAFTRPHHRRGGRRDERDAKLDAMRRARRAQRNPYKLSDHLTHKSSTQLTIVSYSSRACMHSLSHTCYSPI